MPGLARKNGEYVKPPTEIELAQALEVFLYWQEHLGKPNCKPIIHRLEFAIARMRDKQYNTVADLKRVIDVVKNDPWWTGQNSRNKRYTEFENIFRNESRVARFIESTGVDDRSHSSLFATEKPTEPEHYDI